MEAHFTIDNLVRMMERAARAAAAESDRLPDEADRPTLLTPMTCLSLFVENYEVLEDMFHPL